MEGLRYWRRLRGMSQQDLAEATGLSQHSITSAETGKVQPRAKNLKKMAEALGVEIVDLVDPAPKDGASSGEGGRRRDEVKVPESLKALLWERLETMPLIPTKEGLFVKLIEESGDAAELLFDQVRREERVVLEHADEVRERLEAGAHINATGRERALVIWPKAARSRRLAARELIVGRKVLRA